MFLRGNLTCAMIAFSLALASVVARGSVFTDHFDAPHDYLAQGVAETGWDGFIGQGAGETVSALNASTDRPGELSMASAGGYWPGATLGPFLYKVVEGDFIATVRVTHYVTTAYNYCGLMARIGAPSAAGPGEDWVSIDFFPQDGYGIVVDILQDGVRNEDAGGSGTSTSGPSYLQLERKGNLFYSRTSLDGVNWVDYPNANYSPLDRPDFEGLPVQVGLWQATFTAEPGAVAFDDFTISGPRVKTLTQACNPAPADEAADVVRDTSLSWTPCENAVQSDVYLGTSSAAVAAAGRSDPGGMLVSQAQDANSYTPPEVLTYGQTYYWRVDGIDAAGAVVAAGDIWSFTVEPPAYVIAAKDITATASSSDKDKGPELTIDGSGLTGDLHGTDSKTMWNTSTTGPAPAWIQYAFDRVYKMCEIWVWNYNSEFESSLNFGPKDVTIQYSINGTDWTTLGDFVFNQGPGAEGYAHNTTIPLGGIAARQIKITIDSGYAEAPVKYGLSEVRFFYLPVWAREPEPATGSLGIDPAVTLSWRPGREAAAHNVYIGTDMNAVRDGLVAPVTCTATHCAPADIELDATYYWKVEEVNGAETPTAWAGDVWRFSTPTFLDVDDMESYSDEEGASIFNAWIDGFGTTTNGCQVGYNAAPFAEQTIVHGGGQSMPFIYDNTGNHTFSEAVRAFPDARDWTRAGIRTLVLFFRGAATNTIGQLYVKINDTKVDYAGDASIMTMSRWKQWNVDLPSLGDDLTAVNTLAIGVADSGSGILYFDDIRLYKDAPSVAQPVDPGTANLMAYFTMENEVKDASGHNYTATPHNITFGDSMIGFGKAAQFNGATAYIDMGTTFSSGLIKNLTNCTFAAWVNYPAVANIGGRVFDFGVSSSSSYAYMTIQNADRIPQFGIRTATILERTATGPSAPAAGWHHLAAVIDASGATPVMWFYLDGEPGASVPGLVPKEMGDTTNNWLGRSLYTDNPYLNGAIDEFRIYNRALTAREILYLAGDR